MSGSEGQQNLNAGEPEAVGKRDPTLKGRVPYPTQATTQGIGSDLKGAWVAPSC